MRCLVILLLSVTITVVSADLFTSLQDMESLAHQEHNLLNALHLYIHKETSKLSKLSQKMRDLAALVPAGQSPLEYIGHPVNAFSLVSRLAREWPLVIGLASDQHELPKELLSLPSEDDLQSALRGLARLQEVYQIDPNQLANGTVADIQSYRPMSASDCFEMGKYWYGRVQFLMTRSWLDLALQKIAEGDTSVQKAPVLAHLYLARTFIGCHYGYQPLSTDGLLHHLLHEHPEYQLSPELAADYKQARDRNCTWAHHKMWQLTREDSDISMSEQNNSIYSEMCRGLGLAMHPEPLGCHYVSYQNPRLLIAPFKMEELNRDPPLVMFHDIISDQEIDFMKTEFLQVRRSCKTLRNNESQLNLYRTCNLGWVMDSTGDTAVRLTRRMSDMTNLAMESAELTQVASYGLGGEFKLHIDAFDNVSVASQNFGNRYATLMFYLNNVENSGRTIYPVLHKSVVPRKGSAVLWFNLDGYGNAMDSMLHAGCPVLTGSKWVLNKWIHEGGQDGEILCPVEGRFPRNYFYINK